MGLARHPRGDLFACRRLRRRADTDSSARRRDNYAGGIVTDRCGDDAPSDGDADSRDRYARHWKRCGDEHARGLTGGDRDEGDRG